MWNPKSSWERWACSARRRFKMDLSLFTPTQVKHTEPKRLRGAESGVRGDREEWKHGKFWSATGVFEGFLKISKEVTLSLPFSFCSGVAQPSYCSSFLPGQNLWALPLVALVAATRKGLALACFSLPHQWLLVAVRVLHSLLSARWSEPRFFSASSQFSDHLGST